MKIGSPTMPSVSPDRLKVPWSGSGLVIFAQRPLIKSLLGFRSLALFMAYPLVVTIASFQHILRPVFPIFDNYERLFVRASLSDHVAAANNLAAYGLLVVLPLFGMIFVTVLRLRRDEWLRYVTVVPRHLSLFLFLISTVFALFGIKWSVAGLSSVSLSLSETSLIGIPILIAGFGMFTVMAEISLAAMIVGRRIEIERERSTATDGEGPTAG